MSRRQDRTCVKTGLRITVDADETFISLGLREIDCDMAVYALTYEDASKLVEMLTQALTEVRKK